MITITTAEAFPLVPRFVDALGRDRDVRQARVRWTVSPPIATIEPRGTGVWVVATRAGRCLVTCHWRDKGVRHQHSIRVDVKAAARKGKR